jgi:hypothetical protein
MFRRRRRQSRLTRLRHGRGGRHANPDKTPWRSRSSGSRTSCPSRSWQDFATAETAARTRFPARCREEGARLATPFVPNYRGRRPPIGRGPYPINLLSPRERPPTTRAVICCVRAALILRRPPRCPLCGRSGFSFVRPLASITTRLSRPGGEPTNPTRRISISSLAVLDGCKGSS